MDRKKNRKTTNKLKIYNFSENWKLTKNLRKQIKKVYDRKTEKFITFFENQK